MKRILVTGGAGSIGSELVRQLSVSNKVYILDHNETAMHDIVEEFRGTDSWVEGRVGDVRDYDTVEDVFADFKPHIVYHAAAYKHVGAMEITPKEAFNTNVMGTYNLVHNAKKFSVQKFVYISTDKAVQSNSVMGATKRLGEIFVKNQGKGFVVVRFGNVLGSRGSVITIWERQMNQGKPVTITDPNMTRYMMTIEEAVSLVIEAGTNGKGGEIIVLDMGEPVRILDMAKKILKEARKEDWPIKVIGTRPGEMMHEKLMFDEEARLAERRGRFYYVT